MAKEKTLTTSEQILKALDGRTQRWLALRVMIHETDLSKKLKGDILFTQEEIDRINEVLGSSIELQQTA